MEPMRISESSRHRRILADLVVELASHSAGFRRSLPQGVLTALADLVRAMNCYLFTGTEDLQPGTIDNHMPRLLRWCSLPSQIEYALVYLSKRYVKYKCRVFAYFLAGTL